MNTKKLLKAIFTVIIIGTISLLLAFGLYKIFSFIYQKNI